MRFIEFDHLKCDECYRCLRECPTKAIAFNQHNRQIIDERCIKCGICQLHCQKGALKIHLDIDKVRLAIARGKKVVASLAPSYAGVFPDSKAGKIPDVLMHLGFYDVEETAIGAESVSLEYERKISKETHSNIITTCCPSSNYLIERYYPQVIPQMLEVTSPMVAHGRDIKSRMDDVMVVFVGPCLAKKAEAEEFSDAVDAVITFRELERWIQDEGIDLDAFEAEGKTLAASQRGRAYPMGGPLWRGDLKTRISLAYEYVNVYGIEACHDFLKSVSENRISGYCAEVNICSGSCLSGPDLPSDAPPFYERLSQLKASIQGSETPEPDRWVPASQEELHRSFFPLDRGEQARHEDILQVLVDMGKEVEEDRLNCGACGYSTCYEKAEAVVLGYSSPEMCLDRLRQNAEGLRSIIFENSPNAICILDDELRLEEVNPSFNRLFNPERTAVRHWPLQAFVDHPVVKEFSKDEAPILSRKIELPGHHRVVIANLVKLEMDALAIGIFTDVTEAEKRRLELNRVKEKTVQTCQDVIDKQMRVVQEIASLLGETAAETKVGLNQLRDIVLEEND